MAQNTNDVKAEVSDAFINFLKERPDFKIGVEVGIAEGGHCLKILALPQIEKLYGIDPHKHYKNHEYCVDPNNKLQVVQDRRSEQCAAMCDGRFTYIRAESPGAAEFFKDGFFDFVFIDAQHHRDAVLKDILAWKPKVKEGGYIAGHDHNQDGVLEALQELIPSFIGREDCWFYGC